MQDQFERLATMLDVTAADVELFARLTATQLRAGKQGTEAIQAASATMTKLCNRAFASLSAHDATNPYGHRDSFLPAVYQLLRAA